MTRRCWRGTADYTKTNGEEAIRKKKRGARIQARCPGGQGTRVNLEGGGDGGGITITGGENSNLKIGTESRAHYSRCSGFGTPLPNHE